MSILCLTQQDHNDITSRPDLIPQVVQDIIDTIV